MSIQVLKKDQGKSSTKNTYKMAVLLTVSVRVLIAIYRMDQASMSELLTFIDKNRIVREDDIKIFIKLTMSKVDSVFQKILIEEKIGCLLRELPLREIERQRLMLYTESLLPTWFTILQKSLKMTVTLGVQVMMFHLFRLAR